MNYAIICKSSQTPFGRRFERIEEIEKGCVLTFVKIGDRGPALHGILLLSILLVGIINLDMVPSIELKDIVRLAQEAGPKLERIAPLLIVLRVMRSMRREAAILRRADTDSSHALCKLCRVRLCWANRHRLGRDVGGFHDHLRTLLETFKSQSITAPYTVEMDESLRVLNDISALGDRALCVEA